MSVKILIGDVRERLRELPDESVHMCCTSPPYWSLRDYGVPGQLGLEATPEEHVRVMVEVFREVRRCLRSDGVIFVNYGDSYQGKQLLGMPWRLAFALQADGWWLRSEIIWAKPNPMPESVTDRPTKSHEHLLLLAKSATYHYDAAAVREAGSPNTHSRGKAGQPIESNEISYKTASPGMGVKNNSDFSRYLADRPVGSPRNLRDVWVIPTAPFPGAHFATFPQALVEPCIKAGTSEHGCCSKCGAPWVRKVTKEGGVYGRYAVETVGWSPGCDCAAPVVPCTVLDCFGGAGTVGLVADKLGRNAVLIELNPEYAAMAERRIRDDCPLFAWIERTRPGEHGGPSARLRGMVEEWETEHQAAMLFLVDRALRDEEAE